MKNLQSDHVAQAALSESSRATPSELQQALAQLEAARRALAASQEESNVVRLQLGVFMITISHLRQKVIRLEKALAQERDAAQHHRVTRLPNRKLPL